MPRLVPVCWTQEAMKRCYFVDSKGLVCKSRLGDLQHHKVPFAHDMAFCRTLKEAVERIKPTVLIGEQCREAKHASAHTHGTQGSAQL